MYQPPFSPEEFWNCLKFDQPHFVSSSTDVSIMFAFKNDFKTLNLSYAVTNVIDFKDEAYIAYMKYPGKAQFFSYFFQFPFNT